MSVLKTLVEQRSTEAEERPEKAKLRYHETESGPSPPLSQGMKKSSPRLWQSNTGSQAEALDGLPQRGICQGPVDGKPIP